MILGCGEIGYETEYLGGGARVVRKFRVVGDLTLESLEKGEPVQGSVQEMGSPGTGGL